MQHETPIFVFVALVQKYFSAQLMATMIAKVHVLRKSQYKDNLPTDTGVDDCLLWQQYYGRLRIEA